LESFDPQHRSWTLGQASFDALLASLHEDRDTASREYERLRLRLIRFFALHRVGRAEDLADEAFNRLARKIAMGEPIRSMSQYVAGIARILILEEHARARREARVLSLSAAATPVPDTPEQALEALEACLGEMLPRNRDLLLRYYSMEGRTHIPVRQRLAEEMGLQMNALRNRALRLREHLEGCVLRRLSMENVHDTLRADLTRE
jgi:DNA-directed RNA polymerase specialized sigma24 family protein